MIVRQGTIASEFFILKEGEGKVVHEDFECNTRTPIADLKPGDYFGEQALLAKSPRIATVLAETDCVCFVLSGEEFDSLFSKQRLNVQFVKRNAIMAEQFEEKGVLEKVLPEKSPAQIELLQKVLREHVLFRDTAEDHKEVILNSMWSEKVSSGSRVIQQGETGDHFYVIEQGVFEVYIQNTDFLDEGLGSSPEVLVNRLGPGGTFGELALMYNSPRAATVVACEDSVLWVLSRSLFRRALKAINKTKFEEFSTFLASVPVLSPLLSSERSQIAEALEEIAFKDQEVIMKQGDVGQDFWIVKKGEVIVLKNDEEVARLKKGDYFGERALLTQERRIATVIANGDVHCLTLNLTDFNALLGPLQSLLARDYEGSSSVQYPPEIQALRQAGHLDSRYDSLKASYIPLSDLKVLGNLGKGSFGLVQLVKSVKNDEVYAMKRLSKAHLVAMDQQNSVCLEKSIMTQLKHPFIVRLHETYKDRDSLYFLMDICPGGDLFSLLRAQTLFQEKTAQFYAASMGKLPSKFLHSLLSSRSGVSSF